ncbi:MAG: molecular chaperone TorD family protein [Candidatus Solibacter usitatus]|nr:molecular chaperone TorD family protein [Candidatus Solibacter usitatus]
MSETTERLTPEIAGLLGEAAEWRLLGLLFEYPTETWREQVSALAADLKDEKLKALAAAALEFATEGLHIALFGPAGTVPVREVTYQGGVQFGYLMAELAAFYDAFGYKPDAAAEADDHLAVEAGFMAYLKFKQAYALADGDSEHAAITAEAAANFLKDHVAMLAQPVTSRLETFGPDYLVEAGRILSGHAGPPPRNSFPLGAPLEDLESDEFTCGPSAAAGDDLVQLTP